MGRESELKYAAGTDAFAALKERYPKLVPITMETTYYDTPGGSLNRLRWTLRRRMENGVSVCTVKTPAGGLARGEWEVECGNIEEGIGLLVRAGAPRELLDHTAGGVTEVCAARFTRLAGLMEAENCTVELALDTGCLLGGGRELPFTEVEVELKAGPESAAAAFAQALAAEFGLTPEPKSKYRRALELAKNG